MITDKLKEISITSGSIEKTRVMNELLEQHRGVVELLYHDCYDSHNYFITKIDPVDEIAFNAVRTIEEDYDYFHSMLERLEQREVTGNAARALVKATLLEFVEEDREMLTRVIQHDLNIGFSMKSFLNIVGEPEKYTVSLAVNLDKVKGINPVNGEWFASRKLDGVRCTARFEVRTENGIRIVTSPLLRSRQGKEFTTLDRLKPAISSYGSYLEDGIWYLDGEVCIIDDNGDEHFDWVMREINRKDHTIENPCYNIFDLLTEDEFYERTESSIFSERLGEMTDAYQLFATGSMNDRIHLLKQERLKSQEDFDRWTQYVSDGGWEGFMLRHDVVYKGGRTKDLLKVKKFQDAEYVILDTINGRVKYGTETFDACSALVFEHKGTRVQVGSGLSKEQRIEWFSHPENIIDKTATIQYFEETKDKQGNFSLRFPVLKYVYEGERDV